MKVFKTITILQDIQEYQIHMAMSRIVLMFSILFAPQTLYMTLSVLDMQRRMHNSYIHRNVIKTHYTIVVVVDMKKPIFLTSVQQMQPMTEIAMDTKKHT